MDARSARRRRRVALLAIAVAIALSVAAIVAHRMQRRPNLGPPIGERVDDFSLPATDGRPITLNGSLRGRRALVLVFTGIDCPVGNLYMPRLVALFEKYAPLGVAFLAINANAHEDVDQVLTHAREHSLPFPVTKDWNNKLADRLRIERVGEVLVLDADARLAYRGAVDDQYARGAAKPEPTRHYLADALDSVLAGRAVDPLRTAVLTCPIDRATPSNAQRQLRRPNPEFARLRRKDAPDFTAIGSVDYARDVSPIMSAKCQQCHRPGEVAPFSLLTFEDVERWAESIAEVVDQGLMPPWHADPRYGRFSNDRSLTEHERAVLLAWVDQGVPAGDLTKATPAAESSQGWTIGQPDFILEMPAPFDVPATGQLPIQKFIVPTGLTQDIWVDAAQAMPGDRAVVHHICVFIIDPEIENSRTLSLEQRRSERPELVCYAPGDMPSLFPPGVAKRIPAGASLEIQVHYQPIGVPRFDRSAVGIRLARGPIQRLAVTRGIANRGLVLPPYTPNIEVKAAYTIQAPGHLLSLTPHMHYRGRDMRYEAIFPDGRRETLLSVPCYDFNWQNVYRLESPLFLPAGTRLEVTAHFDNSSANPFNPDPSKEVRWGEQSTDEMMIGYFDYCVDLPEPRMAERGPRVTR